MSTRRLHHARFQHPTLAFFAGAIILGVEFAGVRQLTPAFGQSHYVWANVIGVVLVALSVGYWLGGRWGTRATSDRCLALAHGAAAVWLALVAFFGPSIANALIPEGLPEPGGLPIAFVGSLLASVILYAVPLGLLATTSPYLVARDARQQTAGRTVGNLYAVGTVGSIVACYVVPLVLLQIIGTRATLLLCAGAAAGTATLAWLRPHRVSGETSERVSPASEKRVSTAAWAVALIAGLGVTVIEFGAVRYGSPWAGQSNHVWAHAIGVCMFALALGAWLGGRWIDRNPSVQVLRSAVATAVIWLSLSVCVGTFLLEYLMPTGIWSLKILPVVFHGSLAGTVILFGVPLVALGMVTPALVRLEVARGVRPGRAVGSVLVASTVGGLAGCLLTAPVLVPSFGTRGTLYGMAAVLLVVLWVAARTNPHRLVAGVATVLLIGFASLSGLTTPLRVHKGQLEEIESGYQTVRVVSGREIALDPSGIPASHSDYFELPLRYLRHDEDSETYQSVLLMENRAELLTGGRYFESMALGAHVVDPGDDGIIDVLIIGYAGGSVYRTLRDAAPTGVRIRCLGVEIDPAVIEIARRHLQHEELETDDLELITGEDARTVVNVLPKERTFDLILVDAYTRTNYVPFQLASREFFQRVRPHLKSGGWVGINVLGRGAHSPVARAVANTATKHFGPTFLAPNPYFPGNVILWTQPDAIGAPRARVSANRHPGMAKAAFFLERLNVRFKPRADDIVLTDDRSPSDRLADEEFGL